MLTNDNDPTILGDLPSLPDPHGQAALLLVESLIHGLCENEILDPRQAIEIGKRAIEVQLEQAQSIDGDAAPMWRSHQLLTAITASLQIDTIDPKPRPDPDPSEIGG